VSHAIPGMNFHFPMDKQNLHLHTPAKGMPRKGKQGWNPPTPSSSASSPSNLSPMMSDLKLNDHKWDDMLSPLSPASSGFQFQTPKKAMHRGDNG